MSWIHTRKCYPVLEKKGVLMPVVVIHGCNPSTWEAEAGGLSSRPVWAILFQKKRKGKEILLFAIT
jgi:hypothetical protein